MPGMPSGSELNSRARIRPELESPASLKDRLGPPARGGNALAADRLRLFEALVGDLTDGVMITEAEPTEGVRRILWINEAIERMTGYEAEELIGKSPKILQGPGTSRAGTERIGLALQAHQPVAAELVNYRKDGSAFWTDIRISPVFGEDGRCTHFVALKRDATARKIRETLDRLRMETLELIAEAAPLADVLAQIAAMVESQSLQAAVTVARIDGERLVRIASGAQATSELATVGLDDFVLSEPARAQLLEGNPVVCPALTGAMAVCPTRATRCSVPCALYPIRSRSGGALLGVVSARVRDRSLLGELVLLSMSEAAQLAEIAFQRDADRRHLEHLALYDPLTDLPNRMLLSAQLASQVASADERQTKFAFAVLDLDRFKLINDALGHAVGDCVLRESAERLRFSLRAGDTLARIGGDEFVLLLQGVASRENAEQAVRRIIASLEQPFVFDGREIEVAASFGVALYPDDSDDTRELFRQADLAMYAHREGRAKPSSGQTQGASTPA
jgi:diguanylate cyclase (GGDEF)-like protein/PAS domain S-box-containing protein